MGKNNPGTGVFVSAELLLRQTFLDKIGLGLINGHTAVHKFGFNAAVGTAFETIWSGGGIYVYPSDSGAAMTLSSDDAADAAAGTGARTVTIFGLDENFDQVEHSLILAGLTAVPVPGLMSRVFRIRVDTAGTGLENAGVIFVGEGTVVLGEPDTIYARVEIGDNQTLMCMATIPRNFTAIAHDIFLNTGTGKDGLVDTAIRPFGSNVFQLARRIVLSASTFTAPNNIPFIIPPKADIEFRAINTQAGTIDVAAGFDYYLRPVDTRS